MVYEAAGMHASLLGFCHESLILGDDLIGQAIRCVRGIEVKEDDLSIEVMRATCIGGPGHYLGSDDTLTRMQRDYVYPSLANRASPKEWVEQGQPILVDSAIARKEKILSTPSRARFAPDVDTRIRERFAIHLS
jgi:trimethylamine--corrinoid protein Co-methyltransferase